MWLVASTFAASPLSGHAWLEAESVSLRNDSAFPWSQVVAVVQGAVMCNIGDVAPGETRSVPLSTCVGDLPSKVDAVEVQTKQGSLLLPLKAPERDGKLSFTLAVTRFPVTHLVLTNTDTLPFTGCTLTLNSTWRFAIRTVEPGESEGIYLTHFRDGRGVRMTEQPALRSLRIACEAGSGTFIFE